jgi:hypothetical protein
VLAETGAHDDRHNQDRLGEIDRAPTAICAGTGTSTPSPVRWRPTIGRSTRSDSRGARMRVIAIVANQQSGAYISNTAASDVDLLRFDLRIIRAMQSSGRPRHDG